VKNNVQYENWEYEDSDPEEESAPHKYVPVVVELANSDKNN